MNKQLTFLLALTFLFLFSGNSFGGVFDKEDESVVMICKGGLGSFSINMKEKTIKNYTVGENKLVETYKINKENEVFIEGVNKTNEKFVLFHRHEYGKEIIAGFRGQTDEKNTDYDFSSTCSIGDKKF
jgi:hypothetical protein